MTVLSDAAHPSSVVLPVVDPGSAIAPAATSAAPATVATAEAVGSGTAAAGTDAAPGGAASHSGQRLPLTGGSDRPLGSLVLLAALWLGRRGWLAVNRSPVGGSGQG